MLGCGPDDLSERIGDRGAAHDLSARLTQQARAFVLRGRGVDRAGSASPRSHRTG